MNVLLKLTMFSDIPGVAGPQIVSGPRKRCRFYERGPSRPSTLEKENDELRQRVTSLEASMEKYKDEQQLLSKELEMARGTNLRLSQQHQQELDELKAEKDRIFAASMDKNGRIGLLEQGIENWKIQFQQLMQLIRRKDEKNGVLTEKYRDQLQLRRTEVDERIVEQQIYTDTTAMLNAKIGKLEHEAKQLADANKRGGKQINELRDDAKRLAALNKEKDTTIKDLEVNLKIRTEERDQAQAQYEFVQQEFLECQESMEYSGQCEVKEGRELQKQEEL